MIEDLEIQGACTHQQLSARRLRSRVLPFADGVHRHITMEGRYWLALDQVLEFSGEPLTEFLAAHDLELSLEYARDMGISLEEAINFELPCRIRGAFEWQQKQKHGPVNGNCSGVAYRRELARDAAPDLRGHWNVAAMPTLSG